MPAFNDMKEGESLDEFHQRCVVPSKEEAKGRKEKIDGFVEFLHTQFNSKPYTVAEVLKSGSLGKGTAVRDSADIDLVVLLNGLSSIDDLKKQRPDLLDRLEREVKHYQPWRGQVKLEGRTPYSLCYTLNGQKVDILPALNFKSVYGTPNGVYSKMKTYSAGQKAAAQDFSASLAPLQIEFVKTQCEAVKKVIRLLKFWKKERGVGIRSYTLELLVIHSAQTKHWRGTADLFREVLTMLADCRNITVAFNTNYRSGQYIDFHQAPPYVVDPANPYMDTLSGAKVSDITKEAQMMLERL